MSKSGKKKKQPLDCDELIALLRARAQRWTVLPNVTSVGVGYKSVGGNATEDLSIQVTVARKLAPQKLRDADIPVLPKFIEAPDGRRVPVDVLERNYDLSFQIVPQPPGSAFPQVNIPNPQLARRSRLPRIMPGISIGSVNGLPGTLGAIVFDNRTGVPCALSNAHVLASSAAQPQAIVLQPGRSDDGHVQNNVAARLLRAHIGLAGDCAVATITDRIFDRAIFELNVVPARIARAQIGDRVIKSGRTTGVTRGIVERIGIVFPHNYGPPIGIRQIGCFEIGSDPAAPGPGPAFSAGGDSGSLVLVRQNLAPTDIAVGLHFAQQVDPLTGAPRSLVCNIHSVLQALDVSLVPKA